MCFILKLLKRSSHHSPKFHMVRFIMELVQNRRFTLTTGNGKQSRLCRLKNGVPRGSVLAPLLFNIYISNLPPTLSSKYAYADELALVHTAGDWYMLEGTFSQDMSTLQAYFHEWKPKLAHPKRHLPPTTSVTGRQNVSYWFF